MNKNTKKLLLLIPVLALAAALFCLVRSLGLSDFSAQGIQAWVESWPYSEVVFFCLQLTSVIVAPIPSNVTAAAGGLLFGFPKGFFITIAAVLAGSSITFNLAKLVGREAVQNFLNKKLDPKYMDLIERKRDVFLWLAFLFPFFPDDLICILAGLTDIPYQRFIVIVLLARPWGLLFASALGGSALSLPGWSIPILAMVLAAAFFFGMKYGDQIENALMEKMRRS
ncbi:MAG: TVP38/TMEM64 family protein [Oscillospiraceae bacterium]|nr:TVP38/TMEM64 family protein [Oscillospiraceae bacterium]